MWTLLLSRQDAPGRFLDRRQLDAGQLKIGRDATKADWAIPDTSGQVSRAHCTIAAVGLELFVTDTSTNGVALNRAEARIAPNMAVPIRVRDRLLLGDFQIEVATEAAGLAASIQPQQGFDLPAAAAPTPGFQQPDKWFDSTPDPIWGAGGAPAAEVHEFLGDALHDFLAPSKPAGGGFAPADPWGGPLSDAFSKPILGAPISAGSGAFAIPEDWAAPSGGGAKAPAADPFAGFGAAGASDPLGAMPAGSALSATDPFAPPGKANDPFGDFGALPTQDSFAAPAKPMADPFGDFSSDPFQQPRPAPPTTGADDPFALPPRTAAEPAADPFAAADPHPSALPPAAAPGPAPDPFAQAFGGMDDPFAAAPPPPAGPVPESEIQATDPFAAAVAQAASVPVPPPVTPAPTAAGADDAWTAFCEGAGLDAAEMRASPDAMRRLGVLYRQVVLGLTDLIQDRAAFKNEFRVERTMIGIGRNNPLKHLPALDSAKLLLGDPLPGFMPADEAVRTAFEDVKRHQLAMLAGVQHALRAVFDRLSPAEIERVMAKAERKRALPFGRGVNPWTVYQAVFEALQKDAASNVNSVMSVAFREGYEAFLAGRS